MFSNFIFQGELSEEVLLPGPVQESFLFAIAHSRPWHSFLPGMFWAKVAELEIAHGNLVNVNENWIKHLVSFYWYFTAVISHTRPPTIFVHFENYVLVDVNQMYP